MHRVNWRQMHISIHPYIIYPYMDLSLGDLLVGSAWKQRRGHKMDSNYEDVSMWGFTSTALLVNLLWMTNQLFKICNKQSVKLKVQIKSIVYWGRRLNNLPEKMVTFGGGRKYSTCMKVYHNWARHLGTWTMKFSKHHKRMCFMGSLMKVFWREKVSYVYWCVWNFLAL